MDGRPALKMEVENTGLIFFPNRGKNYYCEKIKIWRSNDKSPASVVGRTAQGRFIRNEENEENEFFLDLEKYSMLIY